jgi:hypothetical protein
MTSLKVKLRAMALSIAKRHQLITLNLTCPITSFS